MFISFSAGHESISMGAKYRERIHFVFAHVDTVFLSAGGVLWRKEHYWPQRVCGFPPSLLNSLRTVGSADIPCY